MPRKVDWHSVTAHIPLAELLIRKGPRFKEVPPRDLSEPFRGSSIGYVCPREEVLCYLHGVWREDEVSPDLDFIFQVGHGIHDACQQQLFKGMLVGSWRCRGCGAEYGSMDNLIPMPDRCVGKKFDIETGALNPCSNHNFAVDYVKDWHLPGFDYKEIDLRVDEPLIYSHPDGILWRGEGMPPEDLSLEDTRYLEVLEVKSASWIAILYGYGAGSVKKGPIPFHRDQIMLYQSILGIERGRILYVDKSGRGLRSSFIEWPVKLDPDYVAAEIISVPLSIEEGIRNRDPLVAKRVCDKKSCARSRECVVSKQCWSLDG